MTTIIYVYGEGHSRDGQVAARIDAELSERPGASDQQLAAIDETIREDYADDAYCWGAAPEAELAEQATAALQLSGAHHAHQRRVARSVLAEIA